MADGTRISDLQIRVDSLEAGFSRNHEAISWLDRKLEASVDEINRMLDEIMLMFSKLYQASLPSDFHPKERSDPLLPRTEVINRILQFNLLEDFL